MNNIFTIGYEGASIEAFLATLEEVGVNHVLDVRDFPISRKKGFSKSRLAEELDRVGIKYTHLKALGDPKEGREAMRRGDKKEFLRVFNEHLTKDEAKDALMVVQDKAIKDVAVLLCYERDPKHCHRSIVASEVKSLGGLEKITHLGVRV